MANGWVEFWQWLCYNTNNIIFGVNSSWSHGNNLKNNFLVLGEGDTFGINGSFGATRKKV